MTDIRPKWKNVARCLQAAASKNNGYAVLQLSVIIDSGGDPVVWFSPEINLFEPRSVNLEGITDSDEMRALLEIMLATK